MATLVDGLGNEELGDAGDPGSKVASIFITGSIVTQSDIQVGGVISGAGALSATIVSGTDFRTGSIDATGGITALQAISGQFIYATTAISGGADGIRAGSIASTGAIEAIQSISGLNVLAQGSVIGAVLNDGDGAVKTVLISQAANIAGMTVVAGSVLTDDNGEGVVNFQAADFANANYMFVCTARQYTIPGASGLNAVASGTRRASGLEILGPSGTVFDWIAVGQR